MRGTGIFAIVVFLGLASLALAEDCDPTTALIAEFQAQRVRVEALDEVVGVRAIDLKSVWVDAGWDGTKETLSFTEFGEPYYDVPTEFQGALDVAQRAYDTALLMRVIETSRLREIDFLGVALRAHDMLRIGETLEPGSIEHDVVRLARTALANPDARALGIRSEHDLTKAECTLTLAFERFAFRKITAVNDADEISLPLDQLRQFKDEHKDAIENETLTPQQNSMLVLLENRTQAAVRRSLSMVVLVALGRLNAMSEQIRGTTLIATERYQGDVAHIYDEIYRRRDEGTISEEDWSFATAWTEFRNQIGTVDYAYGEYSIDELKEAVELAAPVDSDF